MLACQLAIGSNLPVPTEKKFGQAVGKVSLFDSQPSTVILVPQALTDGFLEMASGNACAEELAC